LSEVLHTVDERQNESLRVLIVDDHDLFRTGLRNLLEEQSVQVVGEAVAADTGSAVRGATIDLWFPSLAQARAWGRRTLTITLH